MNWVVAYKEYSYALCFQCILSSIKIVLMTFSIKIF